MSEFGGAASLETAAVGLEINRVSSNRAIPRLDPVALARFRSSAENFPDFGFLESV